MAQAMGSRWLSNSRATAEIESGGELHRLQLPALVEVSQWMADLFLYAVAYASKNGFIGNKLKTL